MDDGARAAALRKWAEDGAVVRALASGWCLREGDLAISVEVVERVEADGSLNRRIVVRDPRPRFLDLNFYLRADNRFQAHWGAALGNADFFAFSSEKYDGFIAGWLSMIFENQGWPFPEGQTSRRWSKPSVSDPGAP